MAEYQLNLIPPPPARYRGWVLTRPTRDFSDADVDLADGIAPLLAALDTLYDRLEPWQGLVRGPSNLPGLTSRELMVLSALADGSTTDAIGRRLGISPRTVGKHLEHAYRKLGCKDRMIAVTIAQDLSLLPVHRGQLHPTAVAAGRGDNVNRVPVDHPLAG